MNDLQILWAEFSVGIVCSFGAIFLAILFLVTLKAINNTDSTNPTLDDFDREERDRIKERLSLLVPENKIKEMRMTGDNVISLLIDIRERIKSLEENEGQLLEEWLGDELEYYEDE